MYRSKSILYIVRKKKQKIENTNTKHQIPNTKYQTPNDSNIIEFSIYDG